MAKLDNRPHPETVKWLKKRKKKLKGKNGKKKKTTGNKVEQLKSQTK